jgi:putative peptidoglycan lipid II flippase
MRSFIFLAVLSISNIILAFLFQWYVTTYFGVGLESDSLFAGLAIPQLILTVVSGSLMHVLVPLFSNENEDDFHKDIWGVMSLIVIFFGSVTLVLMMTSKLWVPLLFYGFSAAGKELTIELTLIQLGGILFSAINGVQWAAYHAKRKFIWVESSSLISGAVGLGLLVIFLPIYGIYAAAWIGVFRLLFQTLLLAPIMKTPIYPDFRSPLIKNSWLRLKPLIIGTSYYKTDTVIDRVLLSTAVSGSLSLYYLTQQIYNAGLQVINKSIVGPLVPVLSRQFKNKKNSDFTKTYYRKLIQVGIIVTCTYLLVILTGRQLLSMVFEYGNLKLEDVNTLFFMMILTGGVYIGGALGQVSSSAFYSRGDSKTPTRFGIWTYSIYLPAKVMCFYIYGIAGLAISTSMFFVINFLLQNNFLRNLFDSELIGDMANDK